MAVRLCASVSASKSTDSHNTYYLVSIDDHMIPPRVQRMMAIRAKATIVESPGSHAVYVSHPKAVVDLIERAAKGS